MSKYIKLDDAIGIITEHQGIRGDTFKALHNAYAVDIVRCGECKYYLPMQKNLPYAMRRRYCNKGAIKATSPDDFCSWGEREGE